jgi:hypothetical protein
MRQLNKKKRKQFTVYDEMAMKMYDPVVLRSRVVQVAFHSAIFSEAPY